MSFLRKKDYYHLIQQDNLDVIISADDTFLTECERVAQEEIESMIRHRYNPSMIFIEVKTFDYAVSYFYGDQIEYSEDDYIPTSTYDTDDRCSYSGYVYKAKEDGVTGTWDATKWTQVCINESLWNVKGTSVGNYPDENTVVYTEGNYITNAENLTGWDGSEIFFKKFSNNEIRIYATALDRTADVSVIARATYPERGLSLPQSLQINSEEYLSGEVTLKNFIPDDTEFSVKKEKNFILGDIRNQLIKTYNIDIALYHAHSRINPRNIPDLRVSRRDEAYDWLKRIAKGSITPDLPIYSDESRGQETEWGSEEKQTHSY